MTVDPAAQEAALPFRVYALEGRASSTDKAVGDLRADVRGHGEALSAQAVTLAKHDEQLGERHLDIIEVKTDMATLVASVVALGEKVATSSNRIAWTFATFSLTLVVTLAGYILVGQ